MAGNDNGWTATERLDSFDCTLANLREIVFACLDAAGARSVAEIGAEHGLFTGELLDWGAGTGAERIVAIDPAPRRRLRQLADRHATLELIVATSHEILPALEPPDAVIIDGDHNYFTVIQELRMLAERAPGARLPLVLAHDIGWPLARRDSYHDPSRIPAGHRRPLSERAFLVPGEPGIAERGLFYECAASEEGGPRNGVLTAIEDFISETPGLRLAIVPPFFGLGVIWHEACPSADAVAAAVAPWDRNPLLERVEAKRVDHLVAEFENLQRVDALRSADYEQRFELIGKLLPLFDSGAFALAERLSRLRQGGRPNFSRDGIARILDQLAGDDIELERMRQSSRAAITDATRPEPAPSPQSRAGVATAAPPAGGTS